MKFHKPTLLLAEIRESFSMAMNALAAHKLRSALTLLGVLIGVFSIIVVMTAMRVLKQHAEIGLSQLGSQTFAIQRWPEVQFGDRLRLAEILAAQIRHPGTGTAGGGESHARRQRRHRRQFLARTDVDPLRQNAARPRGCSAKPPAVSRRATGTLTTAAPCPDNDVDNARDVCVLGSALAKTAFPFGSPVGEEIKINGFKYAVVGVLAPKGGSLGGNRTISPSSPSPRRSTATGAGGMT